MHILQIANFHSPVSGGIRVALAALASEYTAAGHRVTQLLPGPTNRVERDGPVTIVRIRGPVIPGLGGYRMVLDRRTVGMTVRHLRPDVVELSDRTTMVIAADVARVIGVPTVLISHERLAAVVGHVLPAGERAVRAVARRHNRRVLQRVDAVVCASHFAAEEYADVGGADFGGAPVVRIPLGVDLERFRPVPVGERRSDPGPLRLATVVRLSPEKDPQLPLEVLAELVRRGRPATLDIAGTGPLAGELVRASRGLPVTFHGHLSERASVARLLSTADVAIAPGPNETFGLAALEALACGTPVVVPDRGALAELVHPPIGESCPSDPVAMADAVERLAGAGERGACRAEAERYPWSLSASRLLDLFEDLRGRRVAVA